MTAKKIQIKSTYCEKVLALLTERSKVRSKSQEQLVLGVQITKDLLCLPLFFPLGFDFLASAPSVPLERNAATLGAQCLERLWSAPSWSF